MDSIMFLKKFINEPQKIGSITPSSKFLVNKMLKNINWETVRYIAELGAGTGVFTEYIVEHKLPDCKFLVIEQDNAMREKLLKKYSDIFFDSQAENLCYTLKRIGITKLDCIICSLPFAFFDDEVRNKILKNIILSLKPNGYFITFQYSLQMRSMLKNYFSNVNLSFEILNLPPAFIYFCHN